MITLSNVPSGDFKLPEQLQRSYNLIIFSAAMHLELYLVNKCTFFSLKKDYALPYTKL